MTDIIDFDAFAGARLLGAKAPRPRLGVSHDDSFARDEFFVLLDLYANARACIDAGHARSARDGIALIQRYLCPLTDEALRGTLHAVRDEMVRRLTSTFAADARARPSTFAAPEPPCA